MKKLLFAAAALLLTAGATQAQVEKTDSARAKKFDRTEIRNKVRKQVNDLNLTEDQKKQFKELNESYRKQYDAIRKEHQSKVQSVYTDEQKAAIETKKKTFAENRTKMTENRKKMVESRKKHDSLRGSFRKEGQKLDRKKLDSLRANGFDRHKMDSLRAKRRITE